jgi:NitT/TauT family transport system substrate-binding protein
MQKLNPAMDAQTFAAAAAAQKPLIETDETARLGLGAMTAERWNTLCQQLVDLKVVPKAPAASDCFIPPPPAPATAPTTGPATPSTTPARE